MTSSNGNVLLPGTLGSSAGQVEPPRANVLPAGASSVDKLFNTTDGVGQQGVVVFDEHKEASPPRRRSSRDVTDEEIRVLFEQGLAGHAIGIELGIAGSVVRNRLDKLGLRKPPKTLFEGREAEVWKMYLKHKESSPGGKGAIIATAKHFGIQHQSMCSFLRLIESDFQEPNPAGKNDNAAVDVVGPEGPSVSSKPSKLSIDALAKQQNQQIKALFEKNHSQAQIAKKLTMSKSAVHLRLKKMGLIKHTSKALAGKEQEAIDFFHKCMNDDGMPATQATIETGKKYGVNKETIRLFMELRGVFGATPRSADNDDDAVEPEESSASSKHVGNESKVSIKALFNQQNDEIRNLFNDKKPIFYIANKMGMVESTVRYRLGQMGLGGRASIALVDNNDEESESNLQSTLGQQDLQVMFGQGMTMKEIARNLKKKESDVIGMMLGMGLLDCSQLKDKVTAVVETYNKCMKNKKDKSEALNSTAKNFGVSNVEVRALLMENGVEF